jgi:hypothetical protein
MRGDEEDHRGRGEENPRHNGTCTKARPLYGDRDFRQCPLLGGGQGVAVEPWTDDEGNRWDDLRIAEIGVIIADFAFPPVSLGGHAMGCIHSSLQ